MGFLDKVLGKKKKEEHVIFAGTPQQIKEKYKVDSSDVNVESICRYYTNGKCNAAEGEINPCSFQNPQNCENCPVWRYKALGDVSALF